MRKTGRNDAASRTNSPTITIPSANAISGRDKSALSVPSLNCSRRGSSGRRGAVGSTDRKNNANAGTPISAVVITAVRQSNAAATHATTTGATRPATVAPELWTSTAVPTLSWIRDSKVVATL